MKRQNGQVRVSGPGTKSRELEERKSQLLGKETQAAPSSRTNRSVKHMFPFGS